MFCGEIRKKIITPRKYIEQFRCFIFILLMARNLFCSANFTNILKCLYTCTLTYFQIKDIEDI